MTPSHSTTHGHHTDRHEPAVQSAARSTRTLGIKVVQLRAHSWLVPLLALYTLASLIHFAHNAEFLSAYPNLPSSFTRSGVYFVWFGLASIGIVGYALYRYRWRLAGLLLLGLYAALGLDGLLHYTRAPLDAHTGMMNFTIWFEVITAAALLLVVLWASVGSAHRRGLDA
jgi:hypothetical protein